MIYAFKSGNLNLEYKFCKSSLVKLVTTGHDKTNVYSSNRLVMGRIVHYCDFFPPLIAQPM